MKKDTDNVLNFFGFTPRTIREVSYLITLADRLEITEELHTHLRQFDPGDEEIYPVFYKRIFILEIAWKMNELVCVEYYPEIAVGHLEDFGLFFQDIWLQNEYENEFVSFYTKHDLSEISIREMVELLYNELRETFEQYIKLTKNETPEFSTFDFINLQNI